MKTWAHPDRKLRGLSAEALTDTKLLTIIISTTTVGVKVKDE